MSDFAFKQASLDPFGKNRVDEGRVERNKAYDQFRDENDFMPAPANPMDVRKKVKVGADKAFDPGEA